MRRCKTRRDQVCLVTLFLSWQPEVLSVTQAELPMAEQRCGQNF